MPSTTSSSFSRLLPSSTVMTPSLPTLSIASAMILPIDRSAFAEIADLRDLLAGGARLGDLLQFRNGGFHRLVDPALEVHRVHAGGHILHAFGDDRLCEHGSGGGAVAGHIGSLAGHFLHHLRAHVLELVLQLDLLRHRHPILGDGGGAEAALEHHIAAFGTQGHLDRIGQNVYARDDAMTGVLVKLDVFCCHLESRYPAE